jgi:hypothetical protein
MGVLGEARDYHGRFSANGIGDPGAVSALAEAQKHLTDEEARSFGSYVFNDGEQLNEALRNGWPLNASDKRVVAGMDSALRKVRATGEIHVWRGVTGMSNILRPNTVFMDPAFVSTSLKRDAAEEFGDKIMRIRVPRGHGIIDAEHIKTVAPTYAKELILSRRSQFLIKGITNGVYDVVVIGEDVL